jgi:hypothetical protein
LIISSELVLVIPKLPNLADSLLYLTYLQEAQVNERTTICNKLSEAGLGDAAEFVKNI